MMSRIARAWTATSLCALAVAALPVAAAGLSLDAPRELLDAQEAFRVSARALGGREVELEFRIADGYYLYRDRLRFAAGSGKPLAGIEIPRGEIRQDAFFGRTETFRDRVRIRVTVPPGEAAKESVTLKVTSQGCADAKVCYAPFEQTVSVRMRGAAARTEGSR
jgi:thiol:disulfide interchange protein DsbD